MGKPLFFLTNDDGFDAPGFLSLIEIVRPLGRIVAVAPEGSQSGKSHAITMSEPLYLRKVTEEKDLLVYACSGTPVDCVKLAFDKLMDERPVLALSGINHGSNSAVSVIYSGTMGAARECSLYNIPSIGLSLLDHNEDADFTAAKHFSSMIIDRVLNEEISLPLCLNVNIPDLPREEIRGVRMCRQSKGYWQEEFERRTDPRGREYYWLKGVFLNQEVDAADTDEHALSRGYVSIVPVQVDTTDYNQLDLMHSWRFR